MKPGTHSIRKGLTVALAFLTLMAVGSNGYAKPFKYKAAGAATFVSTAFSYDGLAPGTVSTGSGKDNLGGTFNIQCVEEYTPTVTSCTAPDGTAGTKFDLVHSDCASTYKEGQTYGSAIGASAGNACASNTTGSLGATRTYTLTGGTGKFASVSGSVITTVTGQTLAAPGSPPGTNGLFGAGEFTDTGSVSR